MSAGKDELTARLAARRAATQIPAPKRDVEQLDLIGDAPPSPRTWNRNRNLAISVFESTSDLGEIESQAATWDDLTTFLADRPPVAASKKGLRLLKLAKFGDKRNTGGKHSLRWDGNVVHLSGIVAEHDAQTVSVDQAAKQLEAVGIAAFIYTTPSHKPDAPRWRVLAPLSVDTAPSEHGQLVDKLNGALNGVLAPESWTLSQVMYYGKVDAEGVVYETRRTKGYPLDLVDGVTPIGKKGGALAEPRVERTAVDTTPSANLDELRKLIGDRDLSSYDEWLRVLRIIHHETGANEDGFDLAVELSAPTWNAKGTSTYGSVANEVAAKWDSFGHNANPETAGSLRRERRATLEDFGPPLDAADKDLLAETSRVRIEFTPLQSFAKREPVRYLVDGLIEIGELFGFIGKRKSGKSYAALDLAFAVAQGRPWAHHAVLEAGPVVWIAAEGARSLQIRRGPQWLAHYGPADIRVWARALNLRREETYKGLLEACRDVRLVVIDSLRRVTPGAKENSSDELAEVLAYAEHLALNTGAAVSFIAHAGKGDATTARGSSAIEDQLEAGFSVEKMEGDNAGKFKVTPVFARDEETGDDVSMFFELQEIAPEGLTPGVVVNWDVDPPPRTSSNRKKGESQWREITDQAITQLGPKFTRKQVHEVALALADDQLDSFDEKTLRKGVNRALDQRLNGTHRTLKATATEKVNRTEVATEFELLPIRDNPDRRARNERLLAEPSVDPDNDLI